ncbi:MAG: hypothetical protein ACJATP_003746 [Candidatus Azotimanducaceae bacterium]|jgi:hypothetical protein
MSKQLNSYSRRNDTKTPQKDEQPNTAPSKLTRRMAKPRSDTTYAASHSDGIQTRSATYCIIRAARFVLATAFAMT